MSDFEVGDEVWFLVLMFKEYDSKVYGQFDTFDPSRLLLKSDIIKLVFEEDKVYFLNNYPGVYFNQAYKTKKDCLNAFKQRLDDLEKEPSMSDLKVGDVVYWIADHVEITHDELSLERLDNFRGIVTDIHPLGCEINYCNLLVDTRKLYKSKQECIDAFKKRLDEL